MGDPSAGMLLELAAPDRHRTGPAAGERLPDFTLPDPLGRAVHYEAARDGRRALLHFFRSTVW